MMIEAGVQKVPMESRQQELSLCLIVQLEISNSIQITSTIVMFVKVWSWK